MKGCDYEKFVRTRIMFPSFRCPAQKKRNWRQC